MIFRESFDYEAENQTGTDRNDLKNLKRWHINLNKIIITTSVNQT